MNERIRELARQTDLWCDMNAIGDAKYNIIWEEKFAELIVRECANVAAEQSAFKPEYRIRKHFGVEE